MNPAQETPKTNTNNDPPVRAASANEWGQITGLEAHAQYFVVRKPTPEYTRERSKALLNDAKAFITANREFAEHQLKEMNEKYGEPAKAKVQELRVVLEKRFDEISKDLETRFEKLEHELGDRGLLPRGKPAATPANASPGETPGEMPAGNGMGASSTTPAKKRPSTTKGN
jgi:hypothetical protein